MRLLGSILDPNEREVKQHQRTAQLVGARPQARVVELFEFGLEGVDRLGDGQVALDLALVRIEQPGEDDHGSN